MMVFCVDVGGTETKYARVTRFPEPKLEAKGKTPTPYSDAYTFLDFLQDLWRKHGNGCEGMALSMPGVIDADTGYVKNAGGVLRSIREIHLAQLLQKRIGVPVSIENDAKSAARAELEAGVLQGCQTAAAIILGTGIGGALIQNGEICRGAHGFAGEFSYLRVNQDQFNLKESVLAVRCGGKALRQAAAQKLGMQESQVDGYEIFDRAESNDADMRRVITDYARQIARFLYNLQCFYDPEKISVGGGISVRPLLIQTIQQEVEAIYQDDPFDLPHPLVVAGKYHNDANLVGACCHFLQHQEQPNC